MRSFLELLSIASKPQATALLKTASAKQIAALSAIAINVLSGALPVKDLAKLSPNFVRCLSHRRVSLSEKRTLLTKNLKHLLTLLSNVDLDSVCENLS